MDCNALSSVQDHLGVNSVVRVKHILLECPDLMEIRQKYFEERSLYSLFRNVIPEVVFDFQREINVFYEL